MSDLLHENRQGPFVRYVRLRDDLLREKIVYQNRVIAKARHEIRLLQDKVSKNEKELCQLKALAQKISRNRSHQLNEAAENLKKEMSHRLQINSDLQTSEAQFRALVEFSIDHIFILDHSGGFIFSNNQVQQFNLKEGKDLIGKKIRDIYPRRVANLFSEKLQYVFDSGEGIAFHHQNEADGAGLHQLNMLYPILHNDQVWAVGGICRDISDQKRIEKQLFQAQKMEALGTLVAGAAHEINNPINLILFNLPLFDRIWKELLPLLERFLRERPNSKIGGLSYDFIKENLPRLIADMELAANRVAHIISRLKDFSRKSNPADKNLVQVNQAVENATRLIGSTLSKSNAALRLDLADGLPPICANLQNLEQIILNLIINAMQSIDHDRGEINIATREAHENNLILIQVSDNGRGVNPSFQEKIFDPFVTDRQAIGGTGLGLSVTYNLVKAHDGDITFKTELGVGTQFTVMLPISTKRKRSRIMVVDDDEAFRKILVKALTEKTNSIVEAYANGAEALIRLGSGPPDLLILDMFMPEIDGLGVCRAIKNELGLEQTKVIIVTGFPDHPNLSEAANMGFNKIIAKPLAIEEFINTVKKSLNGVDTTEITNPDCR